MTESLETLTGPQDRSSVSDAEFVAGEVYRSVRLRVWTVIVAAVAVPFLIHWLARGIGWLCKLWIYRPGLTYTAEVERWKLFDFWWTPLFYSMLAGLLVGVSVLPTWLARRPVVPRLGLRWPRTPWRAAVIAVTAAPALAQATGCMWVWVQRWWGAPLRSPALEHIAQRIRNATGWQLFFEVAITIFMVPFVEELFFRGYLQRRLVARWGPAWGIALASVAFGIYHMDWVQGLHVMFLGAFFGYVCWRTGSIWLGVLCHAALNGTSLMMTLRMPGRLPLSSLVALPVLGLGLVALAVWGLETVYRRPPTSAGIRAKTGAATGLENEPLDLAESVP